MMFLSAACIVAVAALSVGAIILRIDKAECRLLDALADATPTDSDVQAQVDRAAAILRQQNDALEAFVTSVRSPTKGT